MSCVVPSNADADGLLGNYYHYHPCRVGDFGFVAAIAVVAAVTVVGQYLD